ncbi:uncharacterized protein LOC107019268 [Solanum pennellii]|uniref:Uncharacterized protein LOC107019268 n=1 Tax=Solanum pennellii TaxID=28526 RepID=A0ABM1GSL7_SOLPN|nr:uncharacterized protein LOC107019268 [Solanum pennellii]
MAQSRQKSYADRKVRDLEFMIGERVLLKVSPMKGVMRFGKKVKLSPRYISPFEIVERIGEVAYQLALPPRLSGVHPNLTFEEEPITILDRRIRKLRSKEIASVKVQWKHRPVEEATCETESDMRINILSFLSVQKRKKIRNQRAKFGGGVIAKVDS